MLIQKDYFAGCETLEEAKARWKELAKIYHPDKHPDPAKKKENEDIMITINMHYQMTCAYIEGEINPDEHGEQGGIIFRSFMKILRRFYFYRASKHTGIERNLCKQMNFYIINFDKENEIGRMEAWIETHTARMKELIANEEIKVNSQNYGVLTHELDKNDREKLKGLLPKLKNTSLHKDINGAKHITLKGDFDNWRVHIIIMREDGTSLIRSFPEKKIVSLQKPKEQLSAPK